jgi:hypothetical protein
LALSLMLVVGLTAFELLLRLLNPPPMAAMQLLPPGYIQPDAAAGYAHAPNFPLQHRPYYDGVHRVLLYTNSLGMHDVEPPPPDARPRILALGCSLTEGLGCEDAQWPWPRQLQHILQQRAAAAPQPPVVVMNAGVMGYNTFQQVARAQALQPRTRATLWLVAYHDGAYGMGGRDLYGPAGLYVYQYGYLWDRNYLFRLQAGQGPFSLGLMDHCLLYRWFRLKTTDWTFQPPIIPLPWGTDALRAAREAMTRLKAAAAAAGVQACVMGITAPYDLEQWTSVPRSAHHRQMEAICRDLGLPWVDTVPELLQRATADAAARHLTVTEAWANSRRDLYHYNQTGLRNLAEVIAGHLPPLSPP